jgi:hypothetical protein
MARSCTTTLRKGTGNFVNLTTFPQYNNLKISIKKKERKKK